MAWPTINAGEYRHPVTIQQQTATTDGSGATVAWPTFTTGMAKIEFMRGSDAVKAGQTTAETFLTVSLRYQPGIVSNMRVVSANGTYLIQSINNVKEMNVMLDLLCIALGANE